MKNILLTILILLTTIILFVQCDITPLSNGNNNKPVEITPEPQLTIYDSEFDFGIVPQHSKITHDFWLHSTGTDTLRILKINPG